ncbi:ketosynthase chain-length factor [Amycolatopsis balhimycina DSM 5908]|uniref:Ketosynthase chain-length factor n=1 Tax=Amycolatopsis balhimycina DSM 5908 TaxID=1081091 RepID=A0A428WP66_AMYBA|nr:ketosynthase chain-length factor [Amycolatopsis balhimycina]RSM44876.1 ketosynthase chain-length factor [Amycolatopsis balhimycina DSM 5908]
MMPAVVTGIGVIAPNGVGTEAYWSATLAGRGGIAPIDRFDATGYPTKLAGTVPDFDAGAYLPGRLRSQTDRYTQFALAASAMALADAGVDPGALPEYEFGVVTASSSGGNEFGQHEMEKLWGDESARVSAYQSIAWFYAATTGQVSIRMGARGPCDVLVAEQAGGLDALAQARRALRADATVMLAGGAEAPLSPYALVCQMAGGRLSHSDDPRRCYLPFSADAAGHVPGEGGAMLVVERKSAGSGYGTIAGWASTFDPAAHTGRPPALRRAVELALADAGLTPADIGVVFADAAAVPGLDLIEVAALTAVFGVRGVPVTAPKTMVGRLNSGAGALDVATALLAMRDGVIPPTTGVDAPAALDLVVDRPREAAPRHALVVARGAGGFNSAVVLSR